MLEKLNYFEDDHKKWSKYKSFASWGWFFERVNWHSWKKGDDGEQYSQENYLVVHGIKEHGKENIDTIVLNVFREQENKWI